MKKLSQNILTIGASIGLAVLFQNCNSNFASLSNAPNAFEMDSLLIRQSSRSPLNIGNASAASGFIFYGEFGVNPNDAMGNKVCEYPSLQKCLTNAHGGSAGAIGTQSSGLSPNSRLHMMTFEFQSNGFLSKNPNAHFAVGLRGHLSRNSNGDPTAVNGRGFIIGTLGTDPRNNSNPACLLNMLEVESYHGDISLTNPNIAANHVFSDTCSDSIFQEGQTYKIELYVSRDQKIGYKVFDAQSNLLQSQLMQDPYNYLDLNLTDFFFGHVFESAIANSSGNWSIIVNNIRTGESEEMIEDHFREPLMSFSVGSNILADNSLVTFNQIKNTGVFINSFAPGRTRIYGCANPASRVDSGISCLLARDFRIIELNNDPAFVKVGSALQILADPILNFPADVYKLVLRTNPESYLNQATLRIDTIP